MVLLWFSFTLSFLKLFHHRFGARPWATRVGTSREDGCLAYAMGRLHNCTMYQKHWWLCGCVEWNAIQSYARWMRRRSHFLHSTLFILHREECCMYFKSFICSRRFINPTFLSFSPFIAYAEAHIPWQYVTMKGPPSFDTPMSYIFAHPPLPPSLGICVPRLLSSRLVVYPRN